LSKFPRILLLNSPFLMYSDILAAFDSMEVPYLDIDVAAADTTENLLKLIKRAVNEFRPDFALTVNHFGVDYDGQMLDTLKELQLPLASWFVDSPELSLHDWHNLKSPNVALFTIDADSVEPLLTAGHPVVKYLPLGSNPSRFNPAQKNMLQGEAPSSVCFVGNTWMREIGERLKKARPTKNMLRDFRAAARVHQTAPRRLIADILEESFPVAASEREALSPSRRHMYDVAVAFESTRGYRLDCVRKILPHTPVVVGNPTWKRVLPSDSFLWMESASYDTILPALYPRFEINFNCTCPYFTGAVNQRVFDVPASGAFVLSDHRDAMDELFTPGTQSATYQCKEEIPEKIKYYLANPSIRNSIAKKARMRVLMEHTYEHRMQTLFATMNAIFGG